jgi:hypothetical protein
VLPLENEIWPFAIFDEKKGLPSQPLCLPEGDRDKGHPGRKSLPGKKENGLSSIFTKKI